MSRLPNYYDRPELELNKYVFAFAKKDGSEVKMISPNREAEPLANLIGPTDFFIHDLVLVPLSQIPRDLEESLNQQFLPASSSGSIHANNTTDAENDPSSSSSRNNRNISPNKSSSGSNRDTRTSSEVKDVHPAIKEAAAASEHFRTSSKSETASVEVSISRGKSRTRASLESARDSAKKIEK